MGNRCSTKQARAFPYNPKLNKFGISLESLPFFLVVFGLIGHLLGLTLVDLLNQYQIQPKDLPNMLLAHAFQVIWAINKAPM